MGKTWGTARMFPISGEQVQYTYDVLNRLAGAQATNGSWGQSYSYDGFSNLTDRTTTAGSVGEYHVVPDPATNRIVGGSYDANGNVSQLGLPGGAYLYSGPSYDGENRFMGFTTEATDPDPDYTDYTTYSYAYSPGNQRVWQSSSTLQWNPLTETGTTTASSQSVTLWGVNGHRLGSYALTLVTQYFGYNTPPVGLWVEAVSAVTNSYL